MKRIFYASGSVLTSDRVADAVVHYAEALAVRETSDTVDIPVRLQTGEVGRAQLLIGPASQLVIVPETTTLEEPDDDDAVKSMQELTARLAAARPQPSERESDDYEADYEGVDFAEATDEGRD